MKTQVDKNQENSSQKVGSNSSEFNFEQWAQQVRPQLLASVQKRGAR